MKRVLFSSVVVFILASRAAWADAPTSAPSSAQTPAPPESDRYGLFGLLDDRSRYGTNWFPEPLSADEADVDNEIASTWFHSESPGTQSDTVSVEVEKSFGLLTLEIAPGYESDRADGETEQGFSNIEFGSRCPVYQYVSPGEFFDTTVVAGMEISPPTNTRVSSDTELVPKLFDLTRIGDHLSVQTGLGDSILVGPVSRGLSSLEYDVVFGYELTQRDLPLPMVHSTIPIAEVDGEYPMNGDDAGHNELFATVGCRFVFDNIKWLPAQPKIGVGYSFPLNDAARDEFHWGIVTSLIFEY